MPWLPFARKRRNSQPENARLAHRAVVLARLAERYRIRLSNAGAAALASRLAGVSDEELDALGARLVPMTGCPHSMPAFFAGYGQGCPRCPYHLPDLHKKSDLCALREEE